ncbi:MAG TPA: transglutaminase family protein [Polyangiaceae bacterium]|nr:transglutaminase family protein [Polyangiaceae bacterium]
MTWRALSPSLCSLPLFLGSAPEHARAPFSDALFALEADVEAAPAENDHGPVELARVASRVRAAARSGASRADALNRTVFGELGFVREVDDRDLRFVLPTAVLAGRRGSCVGLGTLYIALGELLGWRVDGVMVPGHFYVRVDENGRTRNVELLRKGEEMPDSWYRARFPAPGTASAEYGRALTPKEVLGVVEYDVGNERRREERFSEARRAYRFATSLFPAFAEAHASLGATEHVMGSLDAALESYATARKENPGLSGVERNVELLEEERARASNQGGP